MERHQYIETSRGVLTTEGLTFYDAKHQYFYNGKELSGITGKIGKKLKKNFESSFVEEGRSQGQHVHQSIETFIKTGREVSIHPAVVWALKQIRACEAQGYSLFSEVLISDFSAFATAVDILAVKAGSNEVILFDTKAGVFNRPYVTLQLSIEKWMIEETTDFRVKSAYCISTRDKELYPVFFEDKKKARAVLYS